MHTDRQTDPHAKQRAQDKTKTKTLRKKERKNETKPMTMQFTLTHIAIALLHSSQLQSDETSQTSLVLKEMSLPSMNDSRMALERERPMKSAREEVSQWERKRRKVKKEM
jgi:hypothetical protein